MLKKFAIIFGAVMLLVGILGFVPGITTDQHLLGVFHVNPAHNVVHLLSGAVAIACGMASGLASQLFFRIFGALYGLVALLGFMGGDRPVLGFVSNNLADSWLHTAIAALALFLGFAFHDETVSHAPRQHHVT
jgi:hypothetical protein